MQQLLDGESEALARKVVELALAAMFAVFAVWAVFGFAFPAEPLPFVLNLISKVSCFVAAIMLFVWQKSEFTTAATTQALPSLKLALP